MVDRKKDFPLYDLLAKEVKENKGTECNAQKISAIVNSLSKEKMEVVMALIYHHSLLCGDHVPGKISYGGKIFDGTKGVKYQIKNIPNELLKILWLYIDGPNFK